MILARGKCQTIIQRKGLGDAGKGRSRGSHGLFVETQGNNFPMGETEGIPTTMKKKLGGEAQFKMSSPA